jgi:isocitrate/isopropylmalate dehydrogenase
MEGIGYESGIKGGALARGALMLRHLKEERAAAAIEKAVEEALLDPNTHKPDIGGRATTRQLSQAIIGRILR